jgi:hypothetical protein
MSRWERSTRSEVKTGPSVVPELHLATQAGPDVEKIQRMSEAAVRCFLFNQ